MLVCHISNQFSTQEVIPGLFNIIHIRNTGIAFGLFKKSGSDYRIAALAGVTLLALLLIAYLISQVKKGHHLETFGLALIFGGAIGNLIDRFRLGEVIDFLDVYWKTHHWPAFNVADSAITVGISIFIACEIFRKKEQPEE